HDVPVTFAISGGDGTGAIENPNDCGPFSGAVGVTTGANGKARACWTMGLTAGTNTVDAHPGLGGPAISGGVFSPVGSHYTAPANPPTQLGFIAQPSNTTAGSPIVPAVQVAVQDHNGVTVAASSAPITIALASGALFTSGPTVTVNAVNGIATFTGLVT